MEPLKWVLREEYSARAKENLELLRRAFIEDAVAMVFRMKREGLLDRFPSQEELRELGVKTTINDMEEIFKECIAREYDEKKNSGEKIERIIIDLASFYNLPIKTIEKVVQACEEGTLEELDLKLYKASQRKEYLDVELLHEIYKITKGEMKPRFRSSPIGYQSRLRSAFGRKKNTSIDEYMDIAEKYYMELFGEPFHESIKNPGLLRLAKRILKVREIAEAYSKNGYSSIDEAIDDVLGLENAPKEGREQLRVLVETYLMWVKE